MTTTPPPMLPQRVRKRVIRRRGSSSLPASYTWLKGIAIFWLVSGVICFLGLIAWIWIGHHAVSYEMEDIAFRMKIYAGFFSLLYSVIAIGMLKRTKWGFYCGLALSSLLLLAFPIGTILGLLTIKAFADGKTAFGVT